MDEESRFRKAVPDSMRAVDAFAGWLRRQGWVVRAPRVKLRPTFEQREGYGDKFDIRAWYHHWFTFEVKGRKHEFTSAETWPFPTLVVDRAAKVDHHLNDFYISVSQSLRFASIITRHSRDQWQRKSMFDTTKGYGGEVYECPVNLARFVSLI